MTSSDRAVPGTMRSAGSSPGPRKKRNPFGRYARLARLAGTSFLTIGFLARLPLAMLTVGALTLVTVTTGSYALGGFAAGAVGVGSAIGAPLFGYLADRTGQRPVLLISAAAHTCAIAVLLTTVYMGSDGAGTPAVLGASFAVGATCPQVGSLARVRWMALTRNDKPVLDTALSYESTADELTFVLGPALVGLLAALIAPWLPFVLAAALTVSMVTAFAVHPTYRAVIPVTPELVKAHPGAAAAASVVRINWPLVAIPVLGMVAMGTFFGATQNALSAFGGTFGAADTAGLLYALLGLTSAFGALSVAYWPAHWKQAWRWVACAASMTAFCVLLLLPGEVLPMVFVLLLVGIPVGPTMVTIYSIGSMVAPDERLGTVMTLLASGVVLGSALGSAVAGALAERSGHSGAFLVSIAAAGMLLVLGLAASAFVRRRRA